MAIDAAKIYCPIQKVIISEKDGLNLAYLFKFIFKFSNKLFEVIKHRLEMSEPATKIPKIADNLLCDDSGSNSGYLSLFHNLI